MSYHGGKAGAGTYQRIINQMPPHSTYVEAFLGMGGVLRAKRPALASIGIDADPAVVEQWRGDEVSGLSVICADAMGWLEDRRWDGSELVYLDPPYLFEVRRQQRPIYRCELEVEDHQRLLAIIRRIPVPVLISGYWSPLYAAELRGWRSIDFQVMTRGGTPATEWLWMNYAEPVALHDYQYLGENFRKRQDIKRKIERWRARLAKMPMLERHVLTAALGEFAAARSLALDPDGGTADGGSTKACTVRTADGRATALLPMGAAIGGTADVVETTGG